MLLELDGEAIEGLLPILNRQGPFFGGLLNGSAHDFHRGTVTREETLMFDQLAKHAVEGFDGIRSVDRSANVLGVVNHRYALFPMA